MACGIILLIAANWEEIPRGLKIMTGIALMLGAHAGGYWLREVKGSYPRSGEALHFAGAGLFLANIALTLGRTLEWNHEAGRVVGDDPANALLRRPYRAPWVHPEAGQI